MLSGHVDGELRPVQSHLTSMWAPDFLMCIAYQEKASVSGDYWSHDKQMVRCTKNLALRQVDFPAKFSQR